MYIVCMGPWTKIIGREILHFDPCAARERWPNPIGVLLLRKALSGRYFTYLLRIVNMQVTWRRQHESYPLTVGLDIFASDASIHVETLPSSSERADDVSEWRLVINSVRHQDAGVYHCQVTAKHSRRRSFDVRLNVKGINARSNFASIVWQ